MNNDNRPPTPDPAATAWTPSDVARELQISLRHLCDLRREDKSFPTPTMLGRCPRWDPGQIRDHLRGQQPPRGKGRIR